MRHTIASPCHCKEKLHFTTSDKSPPTLGNRFQDWAKIPRWRPWQFAPSTPPPSSTPCPLNGPDSRQKRAFYFVSENSSLENPKKRAKMSWMAGWTRQVDTYHLELGYGKREDDSDSEGGTAQREFSSPGGGVGSPDAARDLRAPPVSVERDCKYRVRLDWNSGEDEAQVALRLQSQVMAVLPPPSDYVQVSLVVDDEGQADGTAPEEQPSPSPHPAHQASSSPRDAPASEAPTRASASEQTEAAESPPGVAARGGGADNGGSLLPSATDMGPSSPSADSRREQEGGGAPAASPVKVRCMASRIIAEWCR